MSWDGNDVPGAEGWNLNLVMFTTTNTSQISFTLGTLHRDPIDQDVPRTTFMWASFSAESFDSYNVSYSDIPISKIWSDGIENHSTDSVTIDLYRQWTTGEWSDESLIQEEKVRTALLDNATGWGYIFKDLISVEDAALKLGVSENQVRYIVREIQAPGYSPSYSYNEDGSILIFNTKNDPAIEVVKAADKDVYSSVGEIITYTVKATNTGNVTLVNAGITDDKAGLENFTYTVKDAAGNSILENAINGEATLNPGEYLEMTATYSVTQADLDKGSIENLAVGQGNPEDPANPGTANPNEPPVKGEDEVVVPTKPNPVNFGSGMLQTGDNTTNIFGKIGLIYFSVALAVLSIAKFALRKK